VLELKDVHFSYPARTILAGANLLAPDGSITFLAGENGAGKTTLLNLICGFLKPQKGFISLGGENIAGRAPHHIFRAGLTRSFQDLRLVPRFSARENLVLALRRREDETLTTALFGRGQRHRERLWRERSDALLADYALTAVAEQPGSELSYGQQKLLTLACCEATGSRTLLLDEPAVGLSVKMREALEHLLLQLKSRGHCLLVIEHQPEFLRRVGDLFVFLRDGRLLSFESANTLLSAALERRLNG
jgi:branched-chain amino acid transport system ATP-binding protein